MERGIVIHLTFFGRISPRVAVGALVRKLFRPLLIGIYAVTLGLAAPLGAVPLAVAAPSNEHIPVCPGPASPSSARCHARVFPHATTSPTGLSPATIKSA